MNINKMETSFEEAYPGAAGAVKYHENQELIPVWELIRAKGFSPEETVDAFKVNAEEVLAMLPGGLLAKVRPEMDHPDFLRYVAAKLGAA